MEPSREIEPRSCSLRGGRTLPPMAATSGNSCRRHAFRGLQRHHLTRVRTAFDPTLAAVVGADRRTRLAQRWTDLRPRHDTCAATRRI